MTKKRKKWLSLACIETRRIVFFYRKGKAVPLQAWSGPEGSRKLRFPDFHDNGTGW